MIYLQLDDDILRVTIRLPGHDWLYVPGLVAAG
jgi:hypothetical protein